MGFPGGSNGKESGSRPKFDPWEGPLEKEMATHSNILGLENSMDRGAWWATVHKLTKSGTWLND